MSNIKIISDGTAQGTQVKLGDALLTAITKIEINPISPGGTVTAVLTVDRVALEMELENAEIECTDFLMAYHIKEALKNIQKHNG